ncbi:endonuclease/exonuclease/phosphatase family protein [Siansivirga zeaxanthinifaciens]|uniref:Endonuclease n=1 Tax=Siansivirga zeaxanthinifaciens CC-SAMT-1 TaxID=1454006 RepID=A0A0C5WJ26_9FLAO|nr:endonuclease/exonuclease/phosphatase family protein [Siansivirga zeaxanthinifaciens]AJR02710.1 endonuclease [Siansivirga zeaxanthinifaciens CC-SAMT-1]
MPELDDYSVKNNLHTISFYNVENLFDVKNDKKTFDDDFLPNSYKNWTADRYNNKLKKLSFAISNIGKTETGKHPALIGLAEVENAKVIRNLLNQENLKSCHYEFIHYDSLDERGIDVALIYDKTIFEVKHSEVFTIKLFNHDGSPDYTRDILLVKGFLDGTLIHVIVNHWSSRREGEKESEEKRLIASNKVAEIISNVRNEDTEAKIIVMGDFNDDPSNESIKNLLEKANLFNPMETLRSFSRGSTNHNRQWNLFDQIFFTTNFFTHNLDTLAFDEANIFDPNFLKIMNGRFKGTPFRTYNGKRYEGGYSDHFPVYAIFKRNN